MSNFKPCPKCNAEGAQIVSFTWWGGIIGPRILSHVKCPSCANQYNGKSGGDNKTGIIIYVAVVGAILFALLVIVAAATIMLLAS